MRIALASDHAGKILRARIREHLERLGHDVVDLGSDGDGPADYPDFAALVGHRVASREAERGVLACGSGVGMVISANKIHGIRAIAPQDETTAELSRRHNDTNVVCFGERLQETDAVLRMLDRWLATAFDGDDRHVRRIEKIRELERHGGVPPVLTDVGSGGAPPDAGPPRG